MLIEAFDAGGNDGAVLGRAQKDIPGVLRGTFAPVPIVESADIDANDIWEARN
jgi:hypothetical protein